MNLHIRALDNRDSQQAIDLILPIQQQEFGVPITVEDQPDLLDIEQYYPRRGGRFWGAFPDGQLRGSIALLPFGNDAAAIRKMFVKEEFRGKQYAIASTLLGELTSYSRDNGFRHLYLGTVSVMHAAIKFYERHGFIKISKNDLPPEFPVMPTDDMFYHLAT